MIKPWFPSTGNKQCLVLKSVRTCFLMKSFIYVETLNIKIEMIRNDRITCPRQREYMDLIPFSCVICKYRIEERSWPVEDGGGEGKNIW